MMRNFAKAIAQSPMERTLVVVAQVIRLSAYLGTSTVRRGVLHYLEVLAPSVALGIAAWFGYALAIGVTLTALAQFLMYLFW